MGRIKIVLLFNEEDERQNEVAKYLKTQPRCKTALITGLLYDWLLKQKGASAEVSLPVGTGEKTIKEMKEALLTDEAFISSISERIAEQNESTDKPEEKQSGTQETTEGAALDMDEDMMLAGLSMFETQM